MDYCLYCFYQGYSFLLRFQAQRFRKQWWTSSSSIKNHCFRTCHGGCSTSKDFCFQVVKKLLMELEAHPQAHRSPQSRQHFTLTLILQLLKLKFNPRQSRRIHQINLNLNPPYWLNHFHRSFNNHNLTLFDHPFQTLSQPHQSHRNHRPLKFNLFHFITKSLLLITLFHFKSHFH